MIQTKDILNKYIKKYPDFGYYFDIVKKIEDNENSYPDICIESCKALLEGVAKSILDQLDQTQTRSEINKKDFIPLYHEAIKKLDNEYQHATVDESVFEIEICTQFGKQVEKLNALRNKRSDISHGRAVPKEENSSKKLARTIKGITDHIVAYILEHFFLLLEVLPKDSLLAYGCEEYEAFNKYLDAQCENFPIAKVPYSRALYDYEPETYRVKYKDYVSLESAEQLPESPIETYDSFTFWTVARSEKLTAFCEINKLNQAKIIAIFDRYWEKLDAITDSEILDAMFVKPAIENRNTVILSLRENLKQFAQEIKQI